MLRCGKGDDVVNPGRLKYTFGREPVRDEARMPVDTSSNVNLDWLLGLNRNLEDGHPDSIRFREILTNENLAYEELLKWLEQCSAKEGPLYARAFRDIVNAIGAALGFTVEFGSYERGGELPFDGFWFMDGVCACGVYIEKDGVRSFDESACKADVERFLSSYDVPRTMMSLLFVSGSPVPAEVLDAASASSLASRIRFTDTSFLGELLMMRGWSILDARGVGTLLAPLRSVSLEEWVACLDGFVRGGAPDAGAQAASVRPPVREPEPAVRPTESLAGTAGEAPESSPVAPPADAPGSGGGGDLQGELQETAAFAEEALARLEQTVSGPAESRGSESPSMPGAEEEAPPSVAAPGVPSEPPSPPVRPAPAGDAAVSEGEPEGGGGLLMERLRQVGVAPEPQQDTPAPGSAVAPAVDAAPSPVADGAPGRKELLQDVKNLEKLIEANPKNLTACIELGRSYMELGELDKALSMMKRVIAEDADNVDANLLLGEIYYEKGEYPKAALSYEVVLNRKPEHVGALMGLARVYCAQEKYMRALKVYQKVEALGVQPSVELELGLAKCYYKQQRLNHVLPHLEKAGALDPENVDVYVALGHYYLDVKRPEEARKAFEEALKRDPDNLKLRTYLNNLG